MATFCFYPKCQQIDIWNIKKQNIAHVFPFSINEKMFLIFHVFVFVSIKLFDLKIDVSIKKWIFGQPFKKQEKQCFGLRIFKNQRKISVFDPFRREGAAHRQKLYTQTPDSPHSCGRRVSRPYLFQDAHSCQNKVQNQCFAISDHLRHEFSHGTYLELKSSVSAFDCLNITSKALLRCSFVPRQGP